MVIIPDAVGVDNAELVVTKHRPHYAVTAPAQIQPYQSHIPADLPSIIHGTVHFAIQLLEGTATLHFSQLEMLPITLIVKLPRWERRDDLRLVIRHQRPHRAVRRNRLGGGGARGGAEAGDTSSHDTAPSTRLRTTWPHGRRSGWWWCRRRGSYIGRWCASCRDLRVNMGVVRMEVFQITFPDRKERGDIS